MKEKYAKVAVKEPAPLQQVERTFVLWRGRRLSYFSGCDYYRLASHPRVVRALRTGLSEHGLSVAASRLTTGNHVLYQALESSLATFFAAPSALLVPSGYLTNLAAAQALAGSFSHAFLDERAHPALWDAALFLGCPTVRFKHRDPEDLARVMRRLDKHVKPILLTDGMFSHDGSAAPLRQYLEILPKNSMILVDDAHGAGVLGANGRGTHEHERLGRDRIIQTATLSKAFGGFGGVILGAPDLRERILRSSRLFVGSTPLPLPLASAALESVRILEAGQTLRQRLSQNHTYVKAALRKAGLAATETPGPILSVVPKTERDITAMKRSLLAADIFPPFIHYPGAPAQGFFRFAISSQHTRAQLDRLVAALRQISTPRIRGKR